MSLSGEIPAGVEVTTTDVLSADPTRIAALELMLAQMQEKEPEPQPEVQGKRTLRTAKAVPASNDKNRVVLAAYDISLGEYQPDEEHPLRVSITDDALTYADGLQVWHLPDEGGIEEIKDFTRDGNTVSFDVTGLSIYAVTGYTVDFHWGEYTYSIEGESEIKLSALLEKLGVTEITVADVAEVAFSDPVLVEVEAIKDEAEQTTDWLLRSLAPFHTDETLTLTLKNGKSVEIKVTDEGEQTYTVTWLNADGTKLEKDENVAANTHPSYDGETPTKVDESGLSYVFVGWEPAITEETVVTGDATFTAKFAIALTITADSATKAYDGEPLTKDSYTSTALRTGDSIESLTYTVKNGIGVDAETVEAINVGTYYNVPSEAKIVKGNVDDVTADYAITYVNGTLGVFRVSAAFTAGECDTVNKTVRYTATISVQGNPGEYAVRIADLTAAENSGLTFSKGSYTYTHAEGVTPEEGMESRINGTATGGTATEFESFPLTVSHMYDGDTLTLDYTADTTAVDHAAFAYNSESGQAELKNTLTLDYVYGETETPAESKDASASVDYTPLTREFVRLEGSWAYWKVTVNPEGYKLNGGNEMTLADTFDDGVLTDAEQVIDYHNVAVDPNDVAYDYRGSTGTFVIPDMTPVTITYRTRITAEPEQVAYFRGTAVLKSSEDVVIASSTAGATEKGIVIYPSASDVAGFGTNYMVKLYVYADGAMQTGLEGAKFILMDANQRPLEYKMGENEGQPVTFTTGSDGYADVDLHDEEAGDVAIGKNTRYYLEMIQTPAGYQKDNTLYSFMIRDNPDYSNYEYYNGDTLKMRLYTAEPGLKVALRFSGSYALRDDQKDNVIAVLQKMEGEGNWVEVERHSYSETNRGYITFTTPLYDENKAAYNQDVFRVVEENVRPWDLPEEINLQQIYFCMVNDGDSGRYSEPQEFFVTAENDTVNVVIENRYEEAQLTIIKMDKNTGAKLAGAKFGVYKIKNGVKVGDAVKEYTTGEDGKLVIKGGGDYESEILYGICETEAPETYMLPLQEIWHYFYFCNDEYLEPSILADLPDGAEALNLTNTGNIISLDNQKKTVSISVMTLWQGNTWPSNTQVTIGLYQSVDGAEPTAVTDTSGNARTVVLSSTAPYNHTTFADLLSRDNENRNITYSIKEELINDVSPLAAGYVQEYGVSDAGVYIVRNKPATSLTVKKEWYDWTNNAKVEDQEVLAAQSPVTFDVYRSTDTVGSGEITNTQMAAAVENMTRVRENLTIGPDTDSDKNWTMTIDDLDQQSDDGQRYFYHVIERVPSFGNEVYSEAYQIEGLTDTVTIKNKVAPETAALTVTKAALVDDPRPASLDRDFEFTLKLENDRYPIREWTVYTDTENPGNNLVTDWKGEVRFTLKPTNPDITPTPGASIKLTLPKNVTATVTETYNSEYTVKTTVGETTAAGASYTYNVENDTALTYTNTLRVVCKIITDGGTQIPFESFKSALARLRSPEAGETFTSPWTIYMLEDYEIPATDEFIVQEGESITLTTASTTDTLFRFKAGQTETDRAVITRGGAGGSILTNAGTLTLENIVLDGNNNTAATDGGLVYSTDTLNLNAKTTLRNSAISGNGGAVYATGMTKETVDPESGENVQTFVPGTVNIAKGVVITGNSAAGASAIWLRGTLNMSGGSITDNTGASDGAVVVENHGDVINLSGSPVISDNTNRANGAANLYIGVDSDNIVNVVAPGLGADAQIGITAMEGHMEIGELFAMAAVGMTDNLKSFVNDKYGYRGKLKDGTLTNVAWDGLELTIKKAVAVVGANANDRFTITLSSPDIKKSSYIIDGTLDYTVTAARTGRPGTIEIRNVKHGDEITISPLPVADYTISEAESNYNPSFAVDGGDPTEASSITFTAEDDKLIELTNTRRLADVKLTKKLTDKLATGTVDFPFTVKLVEKDGTPVSGFPLVTDTETPENSVITDENGEAAITMSPTHNGQDVFGFRAPVGAVLTITETDNSAYRITASALTMPTEGEAAAIEDGDREHDNVFAISSVTDDGAAVTFSNERKMSDIELRKVLVGKVSKTESFELTVTLKNEDDSPAANFIMHEDADHPKNNITADENGQAKIPFVFGTNESSKSVSLSLPIGTKLTVEEKEVKKIVNGTEQPIYDTTYSIDGAAAVTGLKASIASLSESNSSIVFTNTRKTQTVTVTNTVSGYSGNVVPFKYTATVTDWTGEETKPDDYDDYDAHSFADGVYQETVIGEDGVPEVRKYFELSGGQTPKELIVPYGATLNVTEGFIVGYDTTVKRGSTDLGTTRTTEFQVAADLTVAFTNSQLIGLRLENETTSKLENVQVYVGYGTKMYRVNEAGDDQEIVPQTSERWATLSIEAGKTAILEIQHQNSVTYAQDYTVKGNTPADGYYYTINNEPSFHEFADPAVLRVYDASRYEVKGKLRYSVSDSIVTFTEQPLVSFDVNGGAWTTEMEGYHDRDGDRKVYQMAVTTDETVAKPTPEPIYPTAESIPFLGWTADKVYAKQDHSTDTAIDPEKAYNFDTHVTAPITLYAVWAKPARDERVVTVKNGLNEVLTVTVTLTNNGPVADHVLFTASDPANNITTGTDGTASFTLSAGESKNLKVPDGAKIVLGLETESFAVSSEYDVEASGDNKSFTIASVDRDGTVTFIPGVCKITDAAGAILYDADGKPAVYGTLAAAFTAYNGTLYPDADHTPPAATQACVKMLVDEYAITSKHAFPTKDVIITTAGKDDNDFPYVGTRDRATLYRDAGYTTDCLFTHQASSTKVTLTNIILDGRNVAVDKTKNGSLIYMSNAGAELEITNGTTIRNAVYNGYDNANGARGAIYANNGTINVNAGLFSNLHARRGGAICAEGSAVLNISGTYNSETGSSTIFEYCYAETDDGGAIYYGAANDLTIDGGTNNGILQVDEQGNITEAKEPGIVFNSCAALANASDGGAIYANTSYNKNVSISGCAFIECSARNSTGKNDGGFGGGGIGAQDVKSLTVSQCTFTNCDTLLAGGGVMARVKSNTSEDSTVSISGCQFINCNGKAQGGGLATYTEDNNASSSKTKLTVTNCEFKNCSSGTNNASGGAIQCYLPRMEFVGTTFEDCWAGKEGGAVNNYFGGGYTTMWTYSSLLIDHCRFIRCRAEDRYDPDALQHYGGGINSKVLIATVKDSYFEDCVSTLKEGGALHLGGQGANSKSTISGSTFKNCTAKNGGGAVLASAETLEISDSNFYGCGSSASNGGAVYHYRNSRGDSTQKYLTITDCTFSADPDDTGSAGCSATGNGGAIWTRATTNVTITGCTIDGCTAGGDGGGVYLNSTTTEVKLTDGSITDCQATNGSAVYVGKKATFSGDLEVSGNTVSNVNSGAIHGGKLWFEGNTVVKNNTCSNDSAYDHDVLLQNDDVTTIYTTANGLGTEASIGVYVTDIRLNNRGKEGKAFGTWTAENGNNYLDSFFNDRDGELYGYQSITDENDKNIYWGTYICKITDAGGNTLNRPNGRPAVYQRLNLAFNDYANVYNSNPATPPVYVKMLVENYKLDSTITNFPSYEFTLTTASRSDAQHPYRGKEGSVCTIFPKSSQLFKLDNASTTFKLESITLDGRTDLTASNGNYRLIEVSNGNVVINDGTTMQYGKASNGGAIEAAAAAQVTVNGVYDSVSKEPTVKFINCAVTGNKPNGGAIRAYNLNIYNRSEDPSEYGTAFINCSAYNGGAITSLGTSMAINGAFFDSCQTQSAGGAIYHNNWEANTSTTVKNCAFENCLTNGNTWAHGGAIEARTANLSVEDCSFKNCSATSDGGAVYHGYVDGSNKPSGNREKTTIKNTTFDGCSTTGSNTSYSFGGSVYTQAKTVEVIDSSFQNSTSANHGGALFCQSSVDGSEATISGTSFDNCSTSRSGGSGGAIYSNTKALTLQKSEKADTSINACIAPGFSGAVHMATSDSVLNVKDSTVISNCYADKGGAIYLKSGVTMNLTGGLPTGAENEKLDTPEFTNNGYTTQNGSIVEATDGACIYLAEGSRINLSGNLKFSRNILPNQPRITNGGITDYVRQDIFLAGYSGVNAASIYIVGELPGDTIWVWPERLPHRLPGDQFAKIADGATVSDETLSHFRNALPDRVTNCSNGEYLAGVYHEGDYQNAYWDKMYTVTFKKIDNKTVAVPGAGFTLYKDAACTQPVATAVSADGEKNTDAQGKLLNKGYVEFSSIRIGVYYMKETNVPTSYRENNATYLVLVGSPNLQPSAENPSEIWTSGALAVENAATLVAQNTTNAGMYYGIFPLDENGKAVLQANLASMSVGVQNIRSDFEVKFMKVDGGNNALPGARFKIYTAILDSGGQPSTFADGYPRLMLWSRDGENYPDPVESAPDPDDPDPSIDHKKFKDADGNNLPKGMVYFRELPIGTYYLLETVYPGRNGDKRRTFYMESDRVFKLEIEEDKDDATKVNVTLSEWEPTEADLQYYKELPKDENDYYVISNQEVVCKLTDIDDNLLCTKAHIVWEKGAEYVRPIPAIYKTLEEGFAAAQTGTFVKEDGSEANVDDVKAIKLKVLKDFSLTEPILYDSDRDITFTTAESSLSESKDRYIFSTTSSDPGDRARARIWRGYDADTSADANAGALITLADGADMTLQNIRLIGQGNTYNGRAIRATEGSSLTVLNNTRIENFAQKTITDSVGEDLKGGAVLLEDGTTLSIDGGYYRTAEFADNTVQNTGSGGAEGGALAVSENCTVNITNAQFNRNGANAGDNKGFGGAVHVSQNASVTIDDSSITGNMAAMGSAIFADNSASVTITGDSITGCSITDNRAGGTNGGAINVGGPNARLYFGGLITVLDNLYLDKLGNSQQMNLVLSEDSNEVINTTEGGLTDGVIGVYAIESTPFENHGLPGKPFGTFGDKGDKRANPQVFRSDHSLALYGVRNEDNSNDDLIYWVDVICKLTDDSDKILYQDISLNISGNKETRKAQAVYARITQPENPDLVKNGFNALRDGFEAAQGTLYSQNGTTYTALTNETVKLKMLKDVALDKGIVHTGSRRAVIFTTAETSVSTDMRSAGDFFPYMTERTDANGTLLTDGIALIIRNDYGVSMIEAGGANLGMTNITLDGARDISRTVIGVAQYIRGDGVLTETPTGRVLQNATATADGGIVFVRSDGAVTVADGATLQNAGTSANGGAVYVTSGGALTVTNRTLPQNTAAEKGGAILQNCAAVNGGAVYAENGASVTVNSGTINGNTAYTGAGFYLAEGSRLYLSGSPYFGGTGVENNTLVTAYTTGEKAGKTAGNFSLNALADDAKNGGMAYTTARQDIYLAGTAETLRSIVLTGALTDPENPNNLMQPGSIWIWAEGETGKNGEINHYKVLKQFAVYGNGVKGTLTNAALEASLKAFRNARTDEATENATSSYLDGTGEGEDAGCIYWSGVKDSRRVILRKVVGPTDGKYSSMQNVSFNVYAHGENDMTKFYVVKHEFKVDNKIILATEPLSGLKPDTTGVFWVGELPFGKYDIEEVGVGWFLLIVGDDDGNGHDFPDGYWISEWLNTRPA